MAARHQRTAEGVLRGDASSRRRRNAYPRRRTLTPAPPRPRGGLARRRASEDGRAEVLPFEPPSDDDPQDTCGGHQGAVALRASALRGSILERLTSPRSPMSMVAFLYLQQRRIRAAKRGKKTSGPPPQPSARP